MSTKEDDNGSKESKKPDSNEGREQLKKNKRWKPDR